VDAHLLKWTKYDRWMAPLFFVLLYLVIRIGLYSYYFTVMDADESIQGLMALHISQGKAFPLFYYGQGYLGSLEAFFVALLYKGGTPSLYLLKMSMVFISAPLVWFVYWISTLLFKDRILAALSALLAVFPSYFFTEWVMKARGYTFGIMLCSFLLLLYLIILEKKFCDRKLIFLFGFFSGLTFWQQSLSISYLVPLTVVAGFGMFRCLTTRALKTQFLLWIAGVTLGLMPMLIYNIKNDFYTLKVLVGLFLDLTGREEYESLGLLMSLKKSLDIKLSGYGQGFWQHLWKYIEYICGIPLSVKGILRLAGYLVLLLHSVLFISFLTLPLRKDYPKRDLVYVWLPLMVIFLLIFIVGFRVNRYISFLYPLMPLWIFLPFAYFPRTMRQVMLIMIIFIVGFNFCVTYNILSSRQSESDYQKLSELLLENRLYRGYTTYNLAYSLAFLTNEKLILSPFGGPKFASRIASYNRTVEQSNAVFFLYRNESTLEKLLQKHLNQHNITFNVLCSDSYRIYYNFSQDVRPHLFLKDKALEQYYRWKRSRWG
jgi:hypothetical protein